MLNVGIRVDGGINIGMGHVMRCLSLAKAFRGMGAKVYFLSRFELGNSKIGREGFEVLKMPIYEEENPKGFSYGDTIWLREDARNIIDKIGKFDLDVLIIDSYNVTESFFLELGSHIKKLCYIDDMNSFLYPVDVLINGNITALSMGYRRYKKDETMLLGIKYNLIREEFKGLDTKKTSKCVKEIMITMGGADPLGLSLRFSKLIATDIRFRDVTVNVIVGNGFVNKSDLKQVQRVNANVILHENIGKMSEIMLRSDVAISSAGSTLYELCACGTPTLSVIVADNQERNANMLSDEGYISNLGWYNQLSDSKMLKCLKLLCDNYQKRLSLSQKMRELVDGKGANRVARKISKLCL
ncbi:MAG: UDP-2,4-diacetamido-2,4,6-trideoxy-beta-L-altropyranose hydrolase [Clostridium sp.]|nr:UDP-2,4-diacetamido-2,4,6-trideoxy-beta-L-altropyranose hydrolase [Clostridium sp.]